MIALLNPYSVGQSIAMILIVIAAVGIVLFQAKRAADRELESKVQFDDMTRFVEYIHKLTDTEGDSLEIFAIDREPRNPDAGASITCNGDWTGFTYERFTGANVLDCLERAWLARRLREDKKKDSERDLDNGSASD